MKKAFRVTSNKDFGNIVKQGKTFRNPCFTIHLLKSNYDYTRVGISVSVKLGCAVIRNKIKRQVRELVDRIVDFSIKNKDIIIIVRQKFLTNSFQENFEELRKTIIHMEEDR